MTSQASTGLFRLWERPVESGVWRERGHVVVSRPDLVRRVLTAPDTFAVDNALDAVAPMPATVLRVLASYGCRLPPTLANNGTSGHAAIRAIVAEAMAPGRVSALRPWLTGLVRRRVAGVVSRLRHGDTIDLYHELCRDVPLLALSRLIELPPDAPETVKRFSRSALQLFWAPSDSTRRLNLATRVARYHRRLRGFVRQADGTVGRLRDHCARTGDGEDAVVAALFFLLVAGQETTSQFLTLLLDRLAHHGEVTTDLVTGAIAAEAVVEEGLRLFPPIVSWRRTALSDTTLDGFKVRSGEPVLLWLAAAGAVVAEHGQRFLPGQRGSRRHVAFGAGAHRCPGDQLARMEAAVVVSEAAPLLRNSVVVRSPQYDDNLSFRMPDALVVRRR